jgi:hypothetical protein
VSRERSSSKEAEDHDEKVRKSHNWVVQARRLSKQLSQDLSKTVDTCERFCLKHAIYFRNLSEPADGHRPLSAIQTTFDELESLKKTLESLAERCDDFAREVSLDRPNALFKGFAETAHRTATNKSICIHSLNFISFSKALK